MTDTEVEVDVEKLEVKSGGRRRSKRTIGRKVCYNEKVVLYTHDDLSPKKKQTKHQHSKKSKSHAAPAVAVSKEMVQSFLGKSTEESCGLMQLGFQLREVDAGNLLEKSGHLKVKETLRVFNNYYLQFIQEEENRCKRLDEEANQMLDGKAIKSSKRPDLKAAKKMPDGKAINSSKRPDLKAAKKMRAAGQILYPEKQFGAIPGVDVGHQFFSRCEMVAVGFHNHWLYGIDYMGQKFRKGVLLFERSNYVVNQHDNLMVE